MGKIKKLPPMDEIHQLILQSVRDSDLIEDSLLKEYVVVVLDMFIHKCDGLELFVDYYDVTEEDLYLYFKELIEKIYKGEV